jgi:RNase P protein component
MDYDQKLEEILDNVKTDRAAINSVLVDAMVYLKKNEENHTRAGMVVAKYFEALQRSNEQLIKVLTLQEKKLRHESDDLSSEELYDMLESEKN